MHQKGGTVQGASKGRGIKSTHGQILNALKADARRLEKNPNDVYNQFFREVFLHELMHLDQGWVLKGGSNIYCRVPGARQTMDLDLYRQSDPTASRAATSALVDRMNGHRVPPYTFVLNHRHRERHAGAIDTERVQVEVRFGVNQRITNFNIDISGDLEVGTKPENVETRSSHSFLTNILPQEFTVLCYPLSNQVADKLCAIYERHGEDPPGNPSTRYHDLFDIALIASQLTLDSDSLRAAIDSQRRIRALSLPSQVEVPDESWVEQYPAKAMTFGGAYQALQNLGEAIRVAGLLLDPVLATPPIQAQTWDPDRMVWD